MASKGLCLFDWNGTLQDDLHHIYECGVQRIFRHFGLPCPTIDEYRNEVTADFMSSFYWPRGIPAGVSAKDLNAIMGEGFKEKGRPPDIFPDAFDTVKTVHDRGYELMLVSGYDSTKLVAAVDRSGLRPFFTLVRGDVQNKPVVLAEARRLSKDPDGPAVVIGDTVEDAIAATAIGVVPYICPRGFHTLARLEDARDGAPMMVIVPTLADILAHLP